MNMETMLRAFARIEVHLANSPEDPDALRKRQMFAARLTGKSQTRYFQPEIDASSQATMYRVWNRLIDGPSYIFEGGHMFYVFEGVRDYYENLRQSALALHNAGKIVEVNFRSDKPKVREWKRWSKKPKGWMVVLFNNSWWEHLGVTR